MEWQERITVKRISIAVLLSACFFTACNTVSMKKSAANEGLDNAEALFKPIEPDAQKYFPDQAKAVEDLLQQGRSSMASGDYSTAMDIAKALPDKVNTLADAVKAKNAEHR